MNAPHLTDWAQGRLAIRIFLVITLGYTLSYGLRAINATIAPELLAEGGLNHAGLGMLTSAYFMTFALMQIPLGIWLDRFGPRRVNAVLMGVAAAGCMVFAMADTLVVWWLGRALLGVGFAAGLMAPLALYRVWYPPTLQTRLAAWALMMGTCGVLLATAPVRALLPMIGWRGVFWLCALVLLLLAMLMWWGLPRQREPIAGSSASFWVSLKGYAGVFRHRFFLRMALMHSVSQGGFISLQTLWIGPWFTRVLGYSPEAAGGWLFAFNATLLVAYLVTGWLAPRLGTQPAVTARVTGVAVLLSTLLLGALALGGAAVGPVAWFALAVVSSVLTPMQARVALVFPQHLGGRALTAFNLMIFAGIFVLQSALGLLIQHGVGLGLQEAEALRWALGALAILQASMWLVFICWRTPVQQAG